MGAIASADPHPCQGAMYAGRSETRHQDAVKTDQTVSTWLRGS